ncbi:T9SS type A sorting domain-containing protein, partial [candidate division WOR-3 bacterium]|nr:T9SS type A sorting domain-containing protein [candidate division WOR-3 bacterium]
IDNRTFDYAFGVATDNSNNIIVTGHSGDPFADYDYFTVKYDSNGMILWQDTIVGDIAYDVAVDNSNNIIVTGYCVKSGDKNYFTVKYDSNGAILWQDTLDNGGSDVAQGVAVDNFNNIIVTGFSELSNLDYFTVKYDSNGTILWQDTIDNSGDDFARGVAVDNSDNIIVTGTSFIDGDNDYFTVKYVPTSGISNDVDSDLIYGPTLYNIYPNPFRDKVEIRLMIEDERWKKEDISLRIYDVTGRLVKSFSLPTTYSLLPTVISWDGRNNTGERATSGVYFLRLETEDYKETRQLLLLK